MLFYALILAVIALVAYNVYVYRQASGTVLQRLAAAWNGSMTIFTAIWVTIVSYIVAGLDGLATLTGQPEFKTVADSITSIMTPNVQHLVAALMPAAVAGLVIWARTRTLPKA